MRDCWSLYEILTKNGEKYIIYLSFLQFEKEGSNFETLNFSPLSLARKGL